jgi:hypothetical protein
MPPLTDVARLLLATEAQRKINEAHMAADKQREKEEPTCQAAEQLALEEAAKVRKAKEAQEAQEAADKVAPDAALKLKAANAAVDKRCLATLADVKTSQDALAMAQAAWIKANNHVELAQEHLRAAERAKKKAKDVHTASSTQLVDALATGVADAKGLVLEATVRLQELDNKIVTDPDCDRAHISVTMIKSRG